MTEQDAALVAIAETLCTERCAQAGDPPCSRVSSEPLCDECLGMAAAVGGLYREQADCIEGLSAEVERLRHVSGLLCNFARHDDDCQSHKLMGCNCGYTDVWKKWHAAALEASHENR